MRVGIAFHSSLIGQQLDETMHQCDILCHAVDVVPTVGLAEEEASVTEVGCVSIETLLDPKQDADIGDRMLVTDSQRP